MIAANRADNLRGAVLMMMSVAAFTFNDACLKFLSLDFPMFQATFLRGLVATGVLLMIARAQGALRPIAPEHRAKVAIRALAEVAAFLPFVIALAHVPFANLVAILQTLPLTVTAAGAIFLAEPVGWRRWSAICVGFGGVLMIVQPGADGFDAYALLGFLSVLAVTLRELVTRSIPASVPSLPVAAITSAAVCLLGLSGALFEPWQPVEMKHGVAIVMASGFICVAYLLSVMVVRVGDIGFVMLFRYTALIWGLLLGWAIAGEWPDVWALAGAAVLASSGAYTLWRESVVKGTPNRGQQRSGPP